jgi:hypothetical protein
MIADDRASVRMEGSSDIDLEDAGKEEADPYDRAHDAGRPGFERALGSEEATEDREDRDDGKEDQEEETAQKKADWAQEEDEAERAIDFHERGWVDGLEEREKVFVGHV